MWKCRMCGKEYDDIRDVMECEIKCLPEFERKQKEKLNNEIAEDMQKLNSLRQEYMRYADKMKVKYKGNINKFSDLFGVDNMLVSKNNTNKLSDNETEALENILKKMFYIK